MKTQTDSEKKRYVPPMLKREAHLREITLSGKNSAPKNSEKGDSGRGSGDSKDFFDNDIFDN